MRKRLFFIIDIASFLLLMLLTLICYNFDLRGSIVNIIIISILLCIIIIDNVLKYTFLGKIKFIFYILFATNATYIGYVLGSVKYILLFICILGFLVAHLVTSLLINKDKEIYNYKKGVFNINLYIVTPIILLGLVHLFTNSEAKHYLYVIIGLIISSIIGLLLSSLLVFKNNNNNLLICLYDINFGCLLVFNGLLDFIIVFTTGATCILALLYIKAILLIIYTLVMIIYRFIYAFKATDK